MVLSIRLGVPTSGIDAFLGGKMRHFSIYSDAGNNGCFPIRFDLSFLQDEGHFEYCFHLLVIKLYKNISQTRDDKQTIDSKQTQQYPKEAQTRASVVLQRIELL